MMWRCFKCETFNNGQSCFICGTDKNTPPPRVPVSGYGTTGTYRPATPSTTGRSTYIASAGDSGESKAWIPIVVVLGVIIFILIAIILSSM